MLCVICKNTIEANPVNGYAGGNNPAPIYLEPGERCCDDCDRGFVIPVRIADHLNIDTVKVCVMIRNGRLLEALEFMRASDIPNLGVLPTTEEVIKMLAGKES